LRRGLSKKVSMPEMEQLLRELIQVTTQ